MKTLTHEIYTVGKWFEEANTFKLPSPQGEMQKKTAANQPSLCAFQQNVTFDIMSFRLLDPLSSAVFLLLQSLWNSVLTLLLTKTNKQKTKTFKYTVKLKVQSTFCFLVHDKIHILRM